MPDQSYRYLIVGAGLAGASAVEGIRELDPTAPIVLIGAEPDLPYNRPPLSKGLWTGKEKLEAIFVHDRKFYEDHSVTLALGSAVTRLDSQNHTLSDSRGQTYRYEKLLLATGGAPRRLAIPGGDLEGISYFRTLADFRFLHGQAAPGRSAVVIGGGFIGSEIAAAMSMNKLNVTMVFPDQHLCARVFPESLGKAMVQMYQSKGVTILSGDAPTAIERQGNQFLIQTRAGQQIRSDLLAVGIGIAPDTELARAAGLTVGNGIEVNAQLQTSHPDIYAAGDNALYPDPILGRRRVEHWDNARNQGKQAGRNLAGAKEPYAYMPFFFSDLFDFGYEAVGEVNSRLQAFADWQEENRTGVIYYLSDNRVRGVMLCNVWNKVDDARALIAQDNPVTPADLRGRIQ